MNNTTINTNTQVLGKVQEALALVIQHGRVDLAPIMVQGRTVVDKALTMGNRGLASHNLDAMISTLVDDHGVKYRSQLITLLVAGRQLLG